MELFDRFFQSIYSKSSLDQNLSSPDVANPNLLLNVTTTASQVQEILSNLDISKYPGADNLPARILKTCAKEISVPLAHLFNSSLKCGIKPTLWKFANISPVHRGDNKELVENYTSISLLPISTKCLMRPFWTSLRLLIGLITQFYCRSSMVSVSLALSYNGAKAI